MNKDKKSKLIYSGVIVLLCVIFACLFGFGLKKVLAMEGAFPPIVNVEGQTSAPKSNKDVVDFLNRVVDDAVKMKPKLDSYDYFSIDDETVETNGSDAFKKNFLFLKGNLLGKLEGSKESYEGKFGEDMTSVLNIPNITEDDIEAFECNYQYYACTSCGHDEKEQLPKCEICGNPYPYTLKYRDEYEIIVTVKPSDKVIKDNFNERTDDEIKALYGNEFDGFLNIDELDVNHDRLELVFFVNRLTDEITSLEYRKIMTVNAKLTFTGELAKVDKTDLSFEMSEGEKFTFTWPALQLSAHELSVEPKTTDNLTAKLICDNPASPDYVVVWTSSDESVFTVDQEGYIKSNKTLGTATVTASYEFQGATYTDSCEVTVKIPAESSEISKKKISLNAGDSFELVVKVLPKDATIKTNKWYSEDESVATVDENGKVTAVKSGKTTIYSLTDDGYFKSSCEVTVK